ncbi:Protein-glutamate methylesterase/protein-glutamine glutaminase [Candidatus Lokiarchaeum ossiferum]|uniref:Protein-glutamate methylesterase/protein-glutamine glutaminase n=1 Tax=Candidatus Lokiarchaeum ossiferum TaxID=2951803 RepID=A0ABY6HM44_9ARCH|nr:Protein-glutamate methylesterase/protein-glutamine glutaminase [Candidatus Lokiarchaeum sp. B-35]
MKSKVLIVEDEQITALDIKMTLENNEFEVVGIAKEGQEAIKKAYEFQPDIVIMDIMLKGEMKGTDAAAYIYSYYNIPIIFLTAFNDEETLNHAKNAEPLGYLNKPFKEKDLFTTIEMALHKHRKNVERRQKAFNFQTIADENRVGLVVIQTGIIKYINSVFSTMVGLEEQIILKWTANQLIDELFSKQISDNETIKFDYIKFFGKFDSKVISIKDSHGFNKNILFSIKTISFENSIAELLSFNEFPPSLGTKNTENSKIINRKSEFVHKEPTPNDVNIDFSSYILSFTECLGNFDRFLILDSLKDQKLGILELEMILGKSQHTVYKIIRFLSERQIVITEKEMGRTVYCLNQSFLRQFIEDWDIFHSEFDKWYES